MWWALNSTAFRCCTPAVGSAVQHARVPCSFVRRQLAQRLLSFCISFSLHLSHSLTLFILAPKFITPIFRRLFPLSFHHIYSVLGTHSKSVPFTPVVCWWARSVGFRPSRVTLVCAASFPTASQVGAHNRSYPLSSSTLSSLAEAYSFRSLN